MPVFDTCSNNLYCEVEIGGERRVVERVSRKLKKPLSHGDFPNLSYLSWPQVCDERGISRRGNYEHTFGRIFVQRCNCRSQELSLPTYYWIING